MGNCLHKKYEYTVNIIENINDDKKNNEKCDNLSESEFKDIFADFDTDGEIDAYDLKELWKKALPSGKFILCSVLCYFVELVIVFETVNHDKLFSTLITNLGNCL